MVKLLIKQVGPSANVHHLPPPLTCARPRVPPPLWSLTMALCMGHLVALCSFVCAGGLGQGANVNAVRSARHGGNGETALHMAAKTGYSDAAVALVDAGADPALVHGGQNVLHIVSGVEESMGWGGVGKGEGGEGGGGGGKS